MRIAFSGAHRTGKSTLLAGVAERLPGYATVDEPYRLLDEGKDLNLRVFVDAKTWQKTEIPDWVREALGVYAS